MLSKSLPVLGAAILFTLLGCSGNHFYDGHPSAPAAPGTPQVSLGTANLIFGNVALGQSSTMQTVTVANTGSAALTIGSTLLSDTTNYALMSTCGTSLAASSTCTLSVSFKPTVAASLPATLQIVDNAGNSPQIIAISGTGTAAPAPQAALSVNSLTFAASAPGTTSAAQTVTLTNTGNATLSGISLALGGNNTANFSLSSTCSGTLAPGASCVASVTFTASAAATNYTASLTFTDNANSVTGSTQVVTLYGSGATTVTGAQASLNPSTVVFPSTISGQSATPVNVTLTNSGTTPLTGIAVSIVGGTASTAFTQTNACPATLAAGANCVITVSFMPFTTGTFAATLTVNDNATGAPQTAALSGTATAAQATFSATSITFPATTVGTTTAPSIVTLTNTGGATLQINSILLGGANASSYNQMTNCGTSLAPGASCNISVTFTPAAAQTYNAQVTVATNSPGSPQVIPVTGSGTTASITHTLYTFPESDNSVAPLYALVNNALKTIDMTMYALQDTTFSGYLVAACQRGVTVRVILDQNLEKSSNTPAYTQLNAVPNCSAVWANKSFQASHQKTITLDGKQTAIMSLNLQSRYYSTTRDYALLTNDANDIAAIQATFNADYIAGTPASGTAGASDFSYQPALGDDLIWSPTNAQAAMLGIINNAQTTLLVENEEMGAANIVSALEAACMRGVSVHIAMVNQSSYATNFKALENAGCGVHVYPDTSTGFYIHAKAVVADYSLPTQSVYMGSINYSNASMTQNRELGLYIADPASVQSLYTTITADYAGGTAY